MRRDDSFAFLFNRKVEQLRNCRCRLENYSKVENVEAVVELLFSERMTFGLKIQLKPKFP